MKSTKTAKPTIEFSLNRLEEIVDTIENGETTLDTAIALYKEGLALSKSCGEQLSRYESEITLLQKEAEGVFVQKPFLSELETDA